MVCYLHLVSDGFTCTSRLIRCQLSTRVTTTTVDSSNTDGRYARMNRTILIDDRSFAFDSLNDRRYRQSRQSVMTLVSYLLRVRHRSARHVRCLRRQQNDTPNGTRLEFVRRAPQFPSLYERRRAPCFDTLLRRTWSCHSNNQQRQKQRHSGISWITWIRMMLLMTLTATNGNSKWRVWPKRAPYQHLLSVALCAWIEKERIAWIWSFRSFLYEQVNKTCQA